MASNGYSPRTTYDGTRTTITSYIPLTTPFAAVSGCSSSYNVIDSILVAYDPRWNNGCYPSEASTWLSQYIYKSSNVASDSWTYTSLGPLVCPSGWSSAAGESDSTSTHVVCCPTAYGLNTFGDDISKGGCISTVTQAQAVVMATITTDTSSIAQTTTTLASGRVVHAMAIQGWQIGQAALVASASSSESTLTGLPSINGGYPSETTAISIPTIASSASGGSGPPSSSTSKIGLGTGIGIALLLVLIAMSFGIRLWWYREKRKDERSKEMPGWLHVDQMENGGASAHWKTHPEPGPSTPDGSDPVRHELMDEARKNEMPVDREPAELENTYGSAPEKPAH